MLVGWTEVRAESPWDDEQRDQAEAALAAEDLICPQCGNPREVCSNPDLAVYPQRSTCYVSAGREQVQRMFDARRDGKPDHEVQAAGAPKSYVVAPKPPADQPTEVLVDGTHVWTSIEDLTPDDDFL